MADLVPVNSMATTGMRSLQGHADEKAPAGGQFIQMQNALVGHRRILLFVAATLMLVGFLSLMLWSSESPYRAVYTGMNEKDASAIVEMLQKEHIPYKLEGGGTVLVPADQVYATRLKLASQNMMPGAGTGFELFDRSNEFGVSDFTQKINLQRALQGELSRTIEVLPQVTAARVHLVMPKESAFADRDRKATASVMLQLMGNQRMTKSSVEAIQNLVAASIPELAKADVTVVDSSGNLLSASEKAETTGEGQTMQDYQTGLEKRMEGRLTSMLEQVVGVGQAVVRVSSKINREYVEQNSQKFNPDEQVLRSEQVNEENRTSSASTPGGVPGMASNTPGTNPAVLADGSVAAGGNAQSGDRATHREQVNNYEISSTTEHRIIPYGSVDKLSVAVIVGGHYTEAEDGSKTFTPRSKAELKGLQTLVQRAVGYDEDRGDTVELQSMSLLDISSSLDDGGLQAEASKAFYLEMARYGVAGLALLLVAWFLLRPLSKHMAPSVEVEGTAQAQNDFANLSEETNARLEQMQRARQSVVHDPERAGKVLREWVGTSS